MDTKCRKCGQTFWADEDWKKVCLDCWKKSRGIETKNQYSEIENLRQQLRERDERIVRLIQENHRRSTVAIPDDLLRSMIQLCHPDKHNGKEAAKRVTQWLLEQR